MLALIAQYHHAVVVLAFIKRECAEVYPGTAAYLLIYFELSGSAVVEDDVLSITYAIGQCLIGDIHGIFACFRNVGYPFGKGFILFFLCIGKARASAGKRILTVPVDLFPLGKAGKFGLLPTGFAAFDIQIE